MKSTRTLRFPIQRLFLLTLVSFVAVAALLGVAASASKANRAAKARAAQANAKSGTTPISNNSDGKQPLAPTAAVIVATLTDNVTAATKIAPAGTINYIATITNNGAASPADDATNLSYSAPLDPNTTLTGAVHASPIAFNDTYNWVGNTQLDTAARALPAVTANDVAVNSAPTVDTFTVTAIAGGATALGGTVTLASPSGAFTYTPPLGRPNLADGASVNDSFTYTITNSADPSLTSTGTVTITLTGRVWYLQAGAAGDGRSNTPSSSPAAMSTAADKSTDFFYVFSNAATLNGPFSVDAGQQLLGQGVNLVVNAITLFTAAAPTPSTSNTAGNCVALAGAPGNNTLSGFNIGNCTGGTAITGANVGTLNVSTMTINTNGGALDLTGVGSPTVSVVLGGTTSTGGARNVNLVGLNGTITLAGGALSGATGNSFDVNNGTATVTYTGTISNSGAKQVSIANKPSGSVTLDGAISGTGTGITLTTNGTSNLTFRGGIVLSTAGNTAFNATGGGNVSVCDENPCNAGATGALVNTLTTTTGTALNVANTSITANNLEFRSISSNGAANGIVLNATGAAGGLKVTGNSAGICGGSVTANVGGTPGSATAPNTADCTGGSIQNSTGAGISLTNTQKVSLTRMRVNNGGDDGITGNTVTDLVLNAVAIQTNGNASNESGIDITDLLGTCSMTNSAVTGSGQDHMFINQTTGTLTAFNITGSQFSNTTAAAPGADGIRFVPGGSSNVTASISSCFFSNNRDDHVQMAPTGSATSKLTINNNTFTDNTATTLGGGITINPSTNTNTRAIITNNDMSGSVLSAINFNLNTDSTAASVLHATATGNFIGNTGVVGSGSETADGIQVTGNGAGTINANISSNDIRQYVNPYGIHVFHRDGDGFINATIQSNTIAEPGAFVLDAIRAEVGAVSGDGGTVCANIGGAGGLSNNVTTGGNEGAGGADIRIRIRFDGKMTFPGYGGGATDSTAVQTYLTGRNSLTSVLATQSSSVAIPYGNGGAGCTLPLTAPAPGIDKLADQTNKVADVQPATTAVAQVETAPAKPAVTAAPVVQLSSKDSMASVLAKVTPKATAAEVARIYGDERPISHHAVRSNFKALAQDPNAPTSGEIITLNTIATFPAGGKSITIKYSATVNQTPALTARQASTQGTVTANAGAISVLTDDPEPAGSANPTVTLLDTTMTWTGATNTDWNTVSNWTTPGPLPAQTAPGVSNPAVNDVVIPNVGTQPNISATDIGIYSLNLANGRTLTITSPRVLTIGGSPGGDLTLDGIISGGNLNLGTGTHVINNAGGTGSLSSTNVATVLSGSTVTLNNNLQAGALAVNAGGSMNITNRTLSLNGSGAALVVPGGATFTTTGSTVIFNGTAAQQAAGIAYNNLTINNTIGLNVTGVTLTGNATVNGALALTSSDLATGAFALTQPNTTASTGVSDVVGTVTRTAAFGTTTLTFGNPNNQITFAVAGTKPTSLTVVLAKASPATYDAAVDRNYTISAVGAFTSTSTLRLRYLDPEVNGFNTEASLNLRRLRTGDSHWVAQIPGSVDTTNNFVESATVLAADLPTQWTFSSLVPTAADGVVTGRIIDASGNPVEGAVVRLQGTQNRKFITDANGVYRFDNVETGGFYTVTPSRANFEFNPSVRSFNQLGQETQAIFTANATDQHANPLDTPEYFVRQHYIDFLGREPDEAGFNFWSDQMIECGGDTVCTERRRENVSAAFYLSIEFRKTGGLVDGVYRAGFGNRPTFGEFMPDTRAVGLGVRVGIENWESTLQANKEAYVNAFVNRPAFRARYDGMEASAFVDALIANTGVTFTSSERDGWIAGLATGGMSRGEVLMGIAENERFASAKFNDSFVMMQYYGYLRRDYDAPGFAFWLNKLNQFNGNFEQAEMVKAFIVSGEFRDRFPR